MKRLLMLMIFITSVCDAQVTGYLGKKLIVHTDVAGSVLMHGLDLDAEYAFLRNLSAVVGVNITNKKYSGWMEGNVDEVFPDPRYTIKSTNAYLGLRLYRTAAYTAPKGIYTCFNYQFGMADISGYTNIDEHKVYGGVPIDETVMYKYTARNVKVSMFELGVGTQNIYFEKWVLDYGTSFCFGSYSYGDANTDKLIKQAGSKYGPNLLRLSAIGDGFEGLGFSFHLRVGYLLF